MLKERRLEKGLDKFLKEEGNALQNLNIKQIKQIKTVVHYKSKKTVRHKHKKFLEEAMVKSFYFHPHTFIYSKLSKKKEGQGVRRQFFVDSQRHQQS